MVVIDRYGDLDTQQFTKSAYLYAEPTHDFSGLLNSAVFQTCLQKFNFAGIVVGSGFESCPDLIETIAGKYELFGNTSETIRSVKDPQRLSETLRSLNIPHPPVLTNTLPKQGDWLIKTRGGDGGHHVKPFSSNVKKIRSGEYLQQQVSGSTFSILFIADGHDAFLISTHECWSRSEGAMPFTFAGAMTRPDLDDDILQVVRQIMSKLTATFCLRGLCGVDFILNQDDLYVLEINPRPTATLSLQNSTAGLFNRHLQACRGEMEGFQAVNTDSFKAMQVVFADSPCRISANMEWPDWVRDIPANGAMIRENQPLLTVYAEANSRSETLELLEQRRQQVRSKIFSQAMTC